MPTLPTRLGRAPRLHVAPSRVRSAPLAWNGKLAARPRAAPFPLFVLLRSRLTFAVLLFLAAVATPSLSVQPLSLTFSDRLASSASKKFPPRWRPILLCLQH
ncbi:unnamed protein product [Closterium sp. NIES-64]|nr:unnamed protein product [Closterium sp. NIES-65]CAI5998326.1 unnamed protein product [Closterium sp. NIES-64]